MTKLKMGIQIRFIAIIALAAIILCASLGILGESNSQFSTSESNSSTNSEKKTSGMENGTENYFTPTIQSEHATLDAANPEQPAANSTYIVESNENGTYNIFNELTNQVIFSNTDGKQAIEVALANLTPDRTWKETVILRGNISGVYNIVIPSYTRIIGEGANLCIADNETSIFEIPTITNNTIDVEMEGINFIGNPTTQDTALLMYKVVNGSYVGVDNFSLRLSRFANFGTALYLFAIASQISGNTFTNCQNSIILANDHGSIVENNFFNLARNDETIAYGLQVIDSNSLKIVNNAFSGEKGNSVGIVCDAQFVDSVIIGNTFNKVSRVAISFGPTERPPEYLILNNVVSGNTFSEMQNGVALEVGFTTPVDTLIFSGNTFRNINTVLRIGKEGANIANTNILFTNNIATTVQTLNITNGASCNAVIKNNLINGNWIP